LILPLVHGEARLQTVAIGDVADAVIAALKGEIPMRADYDLVEEESHSLREIVRAMRGAQGFAAPLAEINLPRIVGDAVSLCADVAGLLGWRSPLRSTAMTVIAGGVTGDSRPWREARGRPLRTLAESLGLLRSSAQERAFARVELILPVMLLTLSAFWIASGVIGVLERESAAGNLAAFDAPTAMGFVIAGSLVDLWIGAGLLWRPFAKMAAIASALVAGAYLCLGSILAPALWLDPLGVYVKVIPAIVLSVALALLLQER
ncbi:MAG TPA: SDR family oxidoreductase, partial [Parvularculaceae bacterium]|nr:SDR family oxidoreductase [Parvularculaceae bacterium]